MKGINLNLPLDNFEKLIIKVGWEIFEEWLLHGNNQKEISSINEFCFEGVNEDWIWGLALPLLSNAYKLKNDFSERQIIGISALPGTGKTTLGKWLEKISLKLNFQIAVISIDDFYLPSEEMNLAIKNNPWNVSRGFPGSHSVELMYEKLFNWKNEGKLEVPVFDKSLREGLGDRSHWRKENPDLLIIEGWFLGVKPLSNHINNNELFEPPLSPDESSYRDKIQNNLKEYLDIWNLIDDVWHIKPLKFEYLNIWKSMQEKQMLLKKGNALKDLNLSNFLRMLNVAIPQVSFDDIDSDVLYLISKERRLIDLKLRS